MSGVSGTWPIVGKGVGEAVGLLLAVDPADFLAGIDTSGGPDACHPWTRAISDQGYGRVDCAGGASYAHRVAWVLEHGRPVPAGLHIDHLCHNRDLGCPGGVGCLHRRCANGRHLEAVSYVQNARRAAERRRRQRGVFPLWETGALSGV